MRALYESFLERVKEGESVKIYGAGKFAKTLCHLFDRNNIKVDAFVVTDPKENTSELLHRPVIGLESLVYQEDCNIVVGFEKTEDLKKTTNFLISRRVKNIIMVSPKIVDDIYCNFVIDQGSTASFCRGMARRKKIIAYINDPQGEYIVRYLRSNGISVEAVVTDWPELALNEDIPVLPYEQISGWEADGTVILTMNSINWQKTYITKLRRSGFENIILISEKIMKEMKGDYRKLFWAGMNAGFHLVEKANIEKGFYEIENERGKNTYRWRITPWDGYPYTKEVLDFIKSGKLVDAYERQFSGFSYLPYDEVPLCEIQKGDMNIEVYMAKSHKDKRLEQVPLPDWVTPIQVGAALTDKRIAEVCDDTGDNISLKNVDYSEGTALYWMWKNTGGQDYIGLFHYRRHMALGWDSLKKLTSYDVLLTVPTFTSKPLKKFFGDSYILESDWNLMMRYIKEYDQAYYETALEYEKERSIFPCNIFIMRRGIFDEMCAFIFCVLEKVDSFYKNIPMIRKDRYLGFLVENLLSIYMMHNAGRLKAAYTDMRFYCPLEEEGHV